MEAELAVTHVGCVGVHTPAMAKSRAAHCSTNSGATLKSPPSRKGWPRSRAQVAKAVKASWWASCEAVLGVFTGSFEYVLGASWKVLGLLWAILKAALGPLWVSLGRSWAVWSLFGGSLGASSGPLGPRWVPLGRSWPRLKTLWGLFWPVLGRSWKALGSSGGL